MFKKGSMGDPLIYTAMKLNSVMDKTVGNASHSRDEGQIQNNNLIKKSKHGFTKRRDNTYEFSKNKGRITYKKCLSIFHL